MSENQVSRSFVKKTDLALKIITYIASIGITALVIAPFVTMISGSFVDPAVKYAGMEEYRNSISFTDALKMVLTMSQVPTGFRNSLIISVVVTVLCIYVSALTAYSMVAYEWKLRSTFSKFIIITMMIPGNITMIGYYQLVWKFHLANRISMVILPFIAVPIAVYFMKLYLEATLSRELVESARMDGAGEFRIFNQMVLPLMKPALATQAIFCFLDNWTGNVIQGIVLVKDTKQVLPYIWVDFEMIDPSIATMLYGIMTVISILPPILLFAFLSKDIVEGVQLGAVKY